MISTRHVAAFISAGSLLAISGLAHGQAGAPTQADFDRCNQQAQAALGTNPSASPSTIPPTAGPRVSSPAPVPPSTGASSSGGMTSSGADSVSGGASPSTIPPTAGPRVSSPAPALPSAGSPPSGGGMGSSGAGSMAGGTFASGSSSASSSSDPQLRGMAAAGLNDSAYQAAYRDCLRFK